MKRVKSRLVWGIVLMIWVLLAVVSHVDAGKTDKVVLMEGKDSERGIVNELQLYAQGAVLMDANSGRVLYGKNQDQILAMASTTKIMTCIIALEQGNLTDRVEVSSYAASMPQVKLGVRQGETYRLEDLLYSLMLESHNDAAVVIAEHIGRRILTEQGKGNVQNEKETGREADRDNIQEKGMIDSKDAVKTFISRMNEKAKELGCENTWFITPNGLDGEETVVSETGEKLEKIHSTTARELAWIMSYCVLNSPKAEKFLEITGTSTYTFSGENGRCFTCYNHNTFLNMMPGALSGKTGFTNRAGYCYVGALEDEGRTFVVALLACGWPYNKNYKWADTRKLMEYGVENYAFRSFSTVRDKFDQKWLAPIPVSAGKTKMLGVTATVPLEVRSAATEKGKNDQQPEGLLMKEGEEITVNCRRKKWLEAPVKEGTCVGVLQYIVEGVVYRQEEIVTADGVEKIDFWWCAEQILGRFLLCGQDMVK